MFLEFRTLSGKSVVMRCEGVSWVCLILSLVRAISCCQDVLFDNGQGVDMGLIVFFLVFPVTVPMSEWVRSLENDRNFLCGAKM